MNVSIKRVFSDRRLWLSLACVAIMALVSMAYFYPDAVKGNVLQQADMQQGAANGHEVSQWAEQTGHTPRWTGSLFSGMPTFQISPSYPSDALIGWINSAMGLWLPNPANLLMMMMMGFFILGLCLRMRWYVALAGALAYGFSSYYIILIGAGHLWKYITLAYIPPTIGGVVLAYRGKWLWGSALAALFAMMQISSNHVQMTYYFLFVVAGVVVVYLIDAIRTKAWRRWFTATGALCVAALLAVGANLPSLYNTYEYSKETIRGGHSELTTTGGDKDTNPRGLDRDYITHYSYEPSETFTLLIPNVKGGATAKPEKGSSRYMSLGSLKQAQELMASGAIGAEEKQYLDWVPQYFGGPEGTNGPVYVGALIVALFVLGLVMVRGPWKWMLLILTVFSIMLAWGRNCMWLTDLMIDHMPMYSKFRTVESILVIAQFTMPLLGMMALQKLFAARADVAWQRYHKQVLWSFGIVLCICLVGILSPGVFGSAVTEADRLTDMNIADGIRAQAAAGGWDASSVLQVLSLQNPRIYSAMETMRYQLVSADALRSFLVVAAALGVLLLYMRRRMSLAIAAAAVVLLVGADLYTVGKRYLDTESFSPKRFASAESQFPLSPADRVVLADTAMNYRVLNIPQFSSAAPSYHHKSIGGYHAAKLTRYQDLIERQIMRNNQQVLNMLNTKYIIDNPNAAPMLNDGALGNAWFVERVDYVDTPQAEMTALDSLDVAHVAVADKSFKNVLGTASPKAVGDTIFETAYAPDCLTYHVRSAAGGVAVLSEVYFPWGWTATIDSDTPLDIARVNYVLRAVHVPAGEYTLVFKFDPQSIRTTVTVARVCIWLIYASVLIAMALYLFRPKGRGSYCRVK